MQDGAPCHRTNVVRKRLREVFGNRFIRLGHAGEWQPRSPDLTPFFLWGYLKNKVYETPPTDLQDLRDRIGRHVAELSDHPEMRYEKTLPEMPRIRWRILAIIGLILLSWRILIGDAYFCCYGGYWL